MAAFSAPGRRLITVDANEAVASIAHRLSEVIALFPITPASPMGELADEWSADGRRNLWGEVPRIVQLESEAGAAGTIHGVIQAGALATTFTASQGLLLMIPNFYKIAGELSPICVHVAARSVATHALSIFGDHSDVMACRQTGFAMLASGSPQEAQDMACIGHAATLSSRVPFLHFFDGFRTSHEIEKLEALSDEDLLAMMDDETIAAHRARGLTPDSPTLRGTAQNPDAFFQAREACNPFYLACPDTVQKTMNRFAARTGRAYRLFDYHGHPEAERVIVLMGSGAEAAHETVDWLLGQGARVGVVKVRLYRPFSVSAFLEALPSTVRAIAVLDRTKEPGSSGEPLYLDVVSALCEAEDEGTWRGARPRIIGGRYGLSSKEFTPAMVKAVFDELEKARPKNHFTVGINDDVTKSSLTVDDALEIEPDDVFRAVFYGLGSDGTVGSNKSSIKIIGERTDAYAQGYFIYDSKKSGSMTISHLRFGPRPIRSTYRIRHARFVACHAPEFLDRHDVLACAAPGATVLLNLPGRPEEAWNRLGREMQAEIIEKRLRLFVIDAQEVAREVGLGRHISAVMQACFFAISGVLPRDEASQALEASIEKAYGKKGEAVVAKNISAARRARERLCEVPVPSEVTAKHGRYPTVPERAPDFVRQVTAVMLEGKGDMLPVSAFPVDGTWPVGTSQWEKRSLALELPVWEPALCIQCNKCTFVCPHAAIRAKVYPPEKIEEAPSGFSSMNYKAAEFKGSKYTIQVAPDDCTGCTLCVSICPGKDKKDPTRKALAMAPAAGLKEPERARWDFFTSLPDPPRGHVHLDVKGSQLLPPLFEFSGACSGCGETPYIKLLTQLFGDRLLIANATGCSSIFGGNLPTTPYTTDREGRGPAWSNSLFEDNAEFGLGFRLAVDVREHVARELLMRLSSRVGGELARAILEADQHDAAAIEAQRDRIKLLRAALAGLPDADARKLARICDDLVKKSVWLVGGDGWAYDIGYGGLDHVLASGYDVNVLVLDTEVYSNTGGQRSKATPIGASAKFAIAGKDIGKKDLGLIAMTYGHVYVASVALGAKDAQTVKAFVEAESYHGPSLIIAYAHCITHGCEMSRGIDEQRLAVESGMWPLYRFDPRRPAAGEPALKLDFDKPTHSVAEYMGTESRFRMVDARDHAHFLELLEAAQRGVERRVALYEHLSHVSPTAQGERATSEHKA